MYIYICMCMYHLYAHIYIYHMRVPLHDENLAREEDNHEPGDKPEGVGGRHELVTKQPNREDEGKPASHHP